MGIFSFVKPGKQIFKTITSVKPAVNKSKLQKAVDSAKLQGLKLKGKTKKFIQKMEQDIDPARKKLRQTTQKLIGEPVTKSGFTKGKDMKKFKTPSLNQKPINKATGGRVGKMGGGLMGRRFGYKSGMSVKGDNKRDIRKTESMIGASKSSKREKGKTKFGMLSVKAGIDKNPNPTLADKIAGSKMKKGKA